MLYEFDIGIVSLCNLFHVISVNSRKNEIPQIANGCHVRKLLVIDEALPNCCIVAMSTRKAKINNIQKVKSSIKNSFLTYLVI